MDSSISSATLLAKEASDDHDGTMHSPLSGARSQRIARVANAELHQDADHPVTDEWIDERLAEIGATRDEYVEVYNALVDGGSVNDPSPLAMPTRELEDAVLAAYAAERRRVLATNELLLELTNRADADWDSVAALLDVSVESLRVRGGRRANSPLAADDAAVTISDAARLLGVARSTVYEWLASGRLRKVTSRGRDKVATGADGQPLVIDI